jgi:hypothetical protein
MNIKYEITLGAWLSADEKARAYQIMGIVLMTYSTDHTVSKCISDRLNKELLMEYSRPVTVMY